MTIVAVVGDASSTTSVGLASMWPTGERAIVAEFDTAGGCLSAWLDVPRAPGLANVVASAGADTWPRIEASVQPTRSGVEVLIAPHRAVEAAATINAATATVVPVLAAIESVVTIADCGRLRGAPGPAVIAATTVVITHRQHAGSAAAAAIGLERVAETAEQLRRRGASFIVALVGSRPYSHDEVATFVGADLVVPVADDPWAASVVAGRAGSSTRLKRSPFMRSMASLATATSADLRASLAEAQW